MPPTAAPNGGRQCQLRQVRGFRTGTPWKGIAAAIGYLITAGLQLRILTGDFFSLLIASRLPAYLMVITNIAGGRARLVPSGARRNRAPIVSGTTALVALVSFLGVIACSGPLQPSTPTAPVATAAPTVNVVSPPDLEATVSARVQATLAAAPTTPPTAAATTAPPMAPPPTATPATLAAPAGFPTSGRAGGPLYEVVQVVDGDTIKVRSATGQVETVRLIGIDTAEVVDPRTPVQCFGREASERAKQLLSNQRVQLEQDPTQDTRDRYGRLLAYVWLEDGTFFYKQMIADGCAHEYTYNTPYKYQAEFKAAQQQARDAQLGLWAPDTCNGDTKQPAERATTAPVEAATATPSSTQPATSTGSSVQGSGVQIVSAIGARPGGNASVIAKAASGATSSINYTTPAGTRSTAQGLGTKTADPTGNVSWTWVIGSGTRQGTGTVSVTCGGATASTSITIG